MDEDVPSPIDLRSMRDAEAWTESALRKRPCRTRFFEAIIDVVAARERGTAARRVLELGSGPGFLLERLVSAVPGVEVVALDFSPAMHAIARERLGGRSRHVTFVERDFKDPRWGDGLGLFDVVLTNQAVHELRHKRHATALHGQVARCLRHDGDYLVSDHFVGERGMADERLYMTVAEQAEALGAAGFARVEKVIEEGGMVLHRARLR